MTSQPFMVESRKYFKCNMCENMNEVVETTPSVKKKYSMLLEDTVVHDIGVISANLGIDLNATMKFLLMCSQGRIKSPWRAPVQNQGGMQIGIPTTESFEPEKKKK